jgi:RNA polymerase sigma-70 factor (ECF subfamily)
MGSDSRNIDGESVEAVAVRARKRWPGVTFQIDQLAHHLAALDETGMDLDRFGEELVLTCACCHFDAPALRILDRDYIARAAPVLAKLRSGEDFVNEVTQEMRHRLLLPPAPRLAKYAGTGPLLSWTRMVLLRVALDVKRGLRPREDAELAGELIDLGHQPTDTIDAQRYRASIGTAITEVFGRLRPDERTLLRLHYLDGLSLDALAALNGVHRATVARWLASLRERLLQSIEREVVVRHRLTKSEFWSMFRRVKSDLDGFVGALVTAPE